MTTPKYALITPTWLDDGSKIGTCPFCVTVQTLRRKDAGQDCCCGAVLMTDLAIYENFAYFAEKETPTLDELIEDLKKTLEVTRELATRICDVLVDRHDLRKP